MVISDFSALPEEFNIDYMVYSASKSLSDEQAVWRMPFIEVVRRNLFKRFDNWIESRQHERINKK